MDRKLIIEETADGSHTIYLPHIDEHYHSVNGAVQESVHVFIEAGLKQFQQENVSILEIGFGTGLNAYLSLLESNKTAQNIHYTSFELHPLEMNFIKRLNYSLNREKRDELFLELHKTEWNKTVPVTNSFSLRKVNADFNEYDVLTDSESFDLIYFDAFAPEKQPEMWSDTTFQYLYKHSKDEGLIVTYCAKGAVRRMMQQAGYKTERLPGPPGKREMLRGRKI